MKFKDALIVFNLYPKQQYAVFLSNWHGYTRLKKRHLSEYDNISIHVYRHVVLIGTKTIWKLSYALSNVKQLITNQANTETWTDLFN